MSGALGGLKKQGLLGVNAVRKQGGMLLCQGGHPSGCMVSRSRDAQSKAEAVIGEEAGGPDISQDRGCLVSFVVWTEFLFSVCVQTQLRSGLVFILLWPCLIFLFWETVYVQQEIPAA